MSKWCVWILVLMAEVAQAQDCVQVAADAVARMQEDVAYLASDELEGRQPGTKGEDLAAAWIEQRFISLGLRPMWDNSSYRQPFTFPEAVLAGKKTALALPGAALVRNEDWYPLQQSAPAADLKNLPVQDAGFGIHAPDLNYSDYLPEASYAGKALLISYSSPDGVHPHSKYIAYHDLGLRVEQAAKRGAAAVIVYNPDPALPDPQMSFKSLRAGPIPVVFVTTAQADAIRKAGVIRRLRLDLRETRRSGQNIAAVLDNGAAETVVIGAHYDHLGYGDEGSRYRGEPAIHNGADDNASGTAAILEMARYLALNGVQERYNYCFIAFSAEERGLLGSKYFTANSPLAQGRVNYMINLDMVGRLDAAKGLSLNGTGTSPRWAEALAALKCFPYEIKTTESGVGPSDHTSFYLQDIPVLHAFTGAHEDYHMPSDDAGKVNYAGMGQVVGFLESLILYLDARERLPFAKTQDSNAESRPRFSVTMGIMPDYAYDGGGVKIDAVTSDRPAQRAGILPGDVLLSLGGTPVADVQAYMQSLSRFKKGDEAVARLRRGSEEIEVTVKF